MSRDRRLCYVLTLILTAYTLAIGGIGLFAAHRNLLVVYIAGAVGAFNLVAYFGSKS